MIIAVESKTGVVWYNPCFPHLLQLNAETYMTPLFCKAFRASSIQEEGLQQGPYESMPLAVGQGSHMTYMLVDTIKAEFSFTSRIAVFWLLLGSVLCVNI